MLSTHFLFLKRKLTHEECNWDSAVGIRGYLFTVRVPAASSLRMRGPQRGRQGIRGWYNVRCARGLSGVVICWLGPSPSTQARAHV